MDNNDQNFPEIEPYTLDPVPQYESEQPQYFEESIESYDEEAPKKRPWLLIGVAGLTVASLLALGGILLSSGGGNNNPNNNGSSSSASGNITLEWWGAFLDSDVVQPLLDKYKTENPNVTISYRNQWPQTNFNQAAKEYQSTLNDVLASSNDINKRAPDIFMVENTWVGNYESYVVPIAAYDEFAATYLPSAVTDFTTSSGGTNAVLGLPLWMDTFGIIYNRDILKQNGVSEPPSNWTQFRTFAQSITKTDRNTIIEAGFAAGTPENTSFSFELTNLLMLQNRVQIADSTKQPIFGDNTNSKVAFDFYKSFLLSNKTWADSDTFKNDAAEFLEQDVAMIFGTSWRYRDLLRYNQFFNLNIDIGVAPVPQLEGQTDPVTGQSAPFLNWSTYWGNMVSNQSLNAAESWKFITWLNQPEQLTMLSDNIESKHGFFGMLSPRIDMSLDLQNDQYLGVFNSSLVNARSWYMVNGLAVKQEFITLLEESSIGMGQISGLQDRIRNIIAQKGQL